MSQQYRMVVHCDENLTSDCVGLVEYTSPDRMGLARASDTFTRESGWLRGYRAVNTYDVCPSCRPKVEARLAQAETAPGGRNDG